VLLCEDESLLTHEACYSRCEHESGRTRLRLALCLPQIFRQRLLRRSVIRVEMQFALEPADGFFALAAWDANRNPSVLSYKIVSQVFWSFLKIKSAVAVHTNGLEF
jgi:hypothetical protein